MHSTTTFDNLQKKAFHSNIIRMSNNNNYNDFLNYWLFSKVPKGFENFDPKHDDTTSKDANANEPTSPKNEKKAEDKTTPEEKAKLKSEKERKKSYEGGNGGDGNDNNDPNFGTTTATILALILLTQLLSSLNDCNEAILKTEREITWTEFQNYLLEPKYVDKIVITKNNTTAIVYVKPNAPGVPQQHSNSMDGRGRSRRRNRNTTTENDMTTSMDTFDDEMSTDIMEMGSASSSSTDTKPKTPQQNNQQVYLFTIGSVESFERKLDQTQRELGFSPKEFVS